MTVIAFDGRTVAADKQITCGHLKSTATKLFKHIVDGQLQAVLAIEGDLPQGMRMVAWYKDGANPHLFPATHREGCSAATMTVFRPDMRPLVYEDSPVPFVIEDRFHGGGVGKYAALGAMLAGADARRAVEIACQLTNECGMGIDTVELYGDAGGAGSTSATAAGATASL